MRQANIFNIYANDHYGREMIQKLSTHGFVWKKKVDGFTPGKVDQNVRKCKKWYISEIHVKHPKELHKKDNELLFLAEGLKIGQVEKLVLNLKDKKTYVVHIKT